MQDAASSSQNVKFSYMANMEKRVKNDKKEPIPNSGTGSIFFNFYNCEQQALRYLSMREHNRFELRQKLLNKGYDATLVESVLDSLASDGFLSEERYVRSFVRSNNKRHPEGKALVLARLCAKGADKAIAKEVLDQMYSPEYTLTLVSAAYEKVSGKLSCEKAAGLSSFETRAKLFKLGFSQADIKLID